MKVKTRTIDKGERNLIIFSIICIVILLVIS